MLAFLTWFGAAGYLLERYADWVLGAVLLGAVAAGTLGWVLINRFLDLILSGEREMDPEEYRLEGTIGRVTVAIPAGGTGEVVFTKGGVRRSEAAHAATGALPRGTEVVITNYAGGFATVEPWSALLDER
jgi:membrane protein implicated in regulation of membrane protease activity